jgi:SH3-like domain-containing protein
MWIYRREQLPLKIIARFESWRKVEDHEGTQGWMHARLLSGTRTALVQGEVRAMRGSPSDDAPIVWRAQPGVVGKITECGNGWCLLDVKGRRGYIRTDHIWGDEALP